ncbi:hypothetical protein FB45DRAFT_160063 [Roridomyces roridus]|uniref:Blue (type 1) copper domain-containing protein n=1 Tax=Roridomyces roridus TaxID=1738132 RepID=A0AAD7FGX0_9AGAR|nr:hypothetical protein FB45DRAFT_160063 [Roridomyces roridus]
MLFAALFLFSSLAAAQYGIPPPPPAPVAAAVPLAPADSPGHVNINVALSGFAFSPANVSAPNGTAVTFWFPNSGLEHSVTQSSFENPCTYLAATSNTSAGFDSGLTQGTQFTIVIQDDTKPIWFHCKQISHCGSFGMVGSINAPTTGSNTFDAFQAAANNIGAGEVSETDNGPVIGATVGVNAVASVAPTNTGNGALPSSAPSSAGANSQGGGAAPSASNPGSPAPQSSGAPTLSNSGSGASPSTTGAGTKIQASVGALLLGFFGMIVLAQM